MATIPRNLVKKPKPPQPPPVRTYTLEEMTAFGWMNPLPINWSGAVPRTPDPRIPSGVDPAFLERTKHHESIYPAKLPGRVPRGENVR